MYDIHEAMCAQGNFCYTLLTAFGQTDLEIFIEKLTLKFTYLLNVRQVKLWTNLTHFQQNVTYYLLIIRNL